MWHHHIFWPPDGAVYTVHSKLLCKVSSGSSFHVAFIFLDCILWAIYYPVLTLWIFVFFSKNHLRYITASSVLSQLALSDIGVTWGLLNNYHLSLNSFLQNVSDLTLYSIPSISALIRPLSLFSRHYNRFFSWPLKSILQSSVDWFIKNKNQVMSVSSLNHSTNPSHSLKLRNFSPPHSRPGVAPSTTRYGHKTKNIKYKCLLRSTGLSMPTHQFFG